MPTTRQAQSQLGISHRILRKWMNKLGIESVPHPLDPRFHMLTDEDVERIRVERRKVEALRTSSAAAPLPHQRAPVPTQPLPEARPLVPVVPRPRLPPRAGVLARTSHSKVHDPLPEGWVTTAGYAALHALSERTVRSAIETGRMSETFSEQGWSYGTTYPKHAFTPQQQDEFHAVFGRREELDGVDRGLPCPRCGWLPGRTYEHVPPRSADVPPLPAPGLDDSE